MKSMTGYGRGEQTQEGYKISAEVSSVNRRQAEINVYLPRELEPLESRVRTEINKRLARGRVTARITLHAGENVVGQAQVNMGLAKAYARELRKLAAELKISNELTLDTLVRAPGVFQADTALADADHFWPAIEAAVQKALDACVKIDRKSTRLNSCHLVISYAVFCLKKKNPNSTADAPADSTTPIASQSR